MKHYLLLAFITTLSFTAFAQGHIKTKATGFAIFDKEENIEWDNKKGYVIIYRDSIVYAPKESASMTFYLEGKITLAQVKYKGKKYSLYSQPGKTEEGDPIEIKKYVAKNHDKYYDILWIHNEDDNDIAIECSALMRRK